MAIRIDVLANVREAQVAREADKLADQFDGVGAKAADKFSDGFQKEMAKASPQIQRAFHGIQNAIAKASEERDKFNRMSESGASQERLAQQAERVEKAVRAEADAYRNAGTQMSAFFARTQRESEASARARLDEANAHRKALEDEARASAQIGAQIRMQRANDSRSAIATAAKEADTLAEIGARIRMGRANDHRNAMEDAAKAAAKLGDSAMSITDQLADLGRTAGMAFRGTAMIGAPILLMDIAGAAGALAGVLGPLTGALGAAAVGFGTLKLGMNGFTDAMSNVRDTEKFNASLASLAPNAQIAAQSLRSMLPEFDALQRATQNSLFAGVGPQLDTFLGKMLPTVQQTTTGVAAAFNEMFTNISNQLMTPETFGSLQQFANNTVKAFEQLAPAVAPLSAALADIMSVGSSFLPGLAAQVSDLAKEFSTWIGEAKADGSLAEWMARGVNAAEALLSTLDDAAKMFDALGDRGMDAINKIVTGFQLASSTVRVLSGDLGALGDMMPALGDIMLEPFNKITDMINTGAKSINFLIRGLNSVTGTHISEIPEMNPIKDVAGGRPMFGGPVWMDHGPAVGATGPGTLSPTRGENRTSRPGGTRTDFPTPGSSGWNGGNPSTFPGGVGVGGRMIAPGNPWQAPYAPGQGGINGAGGRGGSKFKGKDWAAPADQWSMDSVPIGSFPGVPGPGPIPNMGGPQIGPVDPQQMWDAQSRQESARFRVEETRQRYLELAHDNTTSETDLLKSKHDVSEAERDFISAQMKAAEVARGKLQSMSKGMQDVGAALDDDFGLSDGLPGLAKNLAAFMGNLATAPLRAQLGATAAAAEAQGQPSGGFGLLGIQGAQNMMSGLSPLLGRPVTDGTGYQGTSSAYGATASAYGSPGGALPGESNRDFAHRAMMPFWQNQGLTVGDHGADKYGEHQNGALDIMVPNIAKGNEVLQQVLSDPNVYGAIFNNQSYGYGHGATPKPYGSTGSPTAKHEDHVHAWYKPGDPGDINPSGAPIAMSGAPGASMPFAGGSIPLPLPVTIVGGGMPGAGMPFGSPASGQGAGPAPGPVNGGDGSAGGLNWDALAAKESGGKWDTNTKNGFYGGLQFDDSTWKQYGGDKIAARADLASKQDQIAIAQKAFDARGGGSSLWPTNYGQLTTPLPPLPAPGSMGGGGGGPGMGMPQGMGFGFPSLGLGAPGGGGSGIFGGPYGNGPTGASMPGPGDALGGPQWAPNIGPGPLQVGPPGVPGGGGAPGSIGPFPTPAGMGLPGGVGPNLPGATAGGTPAGTPPGGGSQIGSVAQQPGVAMGGTGGIGVSGGLMDAAMMAAGGLDMLAPGAGQAAQIGIKLANRAVEYGSQLAGIGVSGLMETFLPTGGSELANGGWIPRIAGGIAGAKPALPNIAGGKGGQEPPPPLDPNQVQQQGQTAPAGQGPNVGVTINNNNATPDQNMRQADWHAQQMYQGANR